MVINKLVSDYKNIREFSYAMIKENILKLYFFPGQKITELELVDILKVGKTPIREALIYLSKEGLVNIIPQSGSYVSKINFSLVLEGVYVRKIIEENINKLAISEFGREDFKDCNLLLKQHNLIKNDKQEHWQYDEKFHKKIYEICGKSNTFNWIQNMNLDYIRIRYLALLDIPKHKSIIEEHKCILDAIENKDSKEVKRLTNLHLDRVNTEKILLMEHHKEYFY